MRWVLCCLLTVSLFSCGASYHYKRTDENGASCELSIWSAREVQAGRINIDPDCNLVSGADSLKVNEKSMEAITRLINKIP